MKVHQTKCPKRNLHEEGPCECSIEGPGSYAGTWGESEHLVHAWIEGFEPAPPVVSDWNMIPKPLSVAAGIFPYPPPTPQPLAPNAFAREPKHVDPWPEKDPEPEVSTLDATKLPTPGGVALLFADAQTGGWEVRIGYSRSLLRTTTLGVFRRVEILGCWFSPHPSGRRPFATYERFADSKEEVLWDPRAEVFRTKTKPSGNPGTWKWNITRVDLIPVNGVTALREFCALGGVVDDLWFPRQAAQLRDKKERKSCGNPKVHPEHRHGTQAEPKKYLCSGAPKKSTEAVNGG